MTSAARDLNLTQSTVSRLIAALEAQLGQTLFTRERKRLVPTEAAIAYQRDLTRGIDLIQRASMKVVANPQGGSLSLAMLPTFGTRWLAPRLPEFLAEHPGVALNFSTRIQRFSFVDDAFDAVIFYGRDDWPDARHLKLFDERVTACVSPTFCAEHDVSQPQDLERLTLLQLENRPDAWSSWFSQHGIDDARPVDGMIVDQFSMMIQAAISGLGIALLPDYLAQSEIADGRLVPLFQQGVPDSGAYWLAWPASNENLNSLHAFREWISKICASSN
jgi:DNA-binding transcriptional LysR family regulator